MGALLGGTALIYLIQLAAGLLLSLMDLTMMVQLALPPLLSALGFAFLLPWQMSFVTLCYYDVRVAGEGYAPRAGEGENQ